MSPSGLTATCNYDQINPFSFRLLWSGCFYHGNRKESGDTHKKVLSATPSHTCGALTDVLGSESDIALRFWWLFYIKSLMGKQLFLMRLLNSLHVSSWNINSVLDLRTQAHTVEGRFSRYAWPGYKGEKKPSLQAQLMACLWSPWFLNYLTWSFSVLAITKSNVLEKVKAH